MIAANSDSRVHTGQTPPLPGYINCELDCSWLNAVGAEHKCAIVGSNFHNMGAENVYDQDLAFADHAIYGSGGSLCDDLPN